MIKYRSKMISVVVVAVIFVLAFLATPALVKDADKSDAKTKSAQTKKADSSSLVASKVHGDPDGGTRPVTPAEEKKLNAEIQKTLSHYQQHQVKQRPDGSLSLVIAPFSMIATVAHVTKDGKLEIDCENVQNSGQKVQQAKKNNSTPLPEE